MPTGLCCNRRPRLHGAGGRSQRDLRRAGRLGGVAHGHDHLQPRWPGHHGAGRHHARGGCQLHRPSSYPGDTFYNATTKNATWLVAGPNTDSNSDGVPDVMETQLGLPPNNGRQTDSGNSTQLKVHKPN
ncbi:MAG: hypothetical protein WDM96_17510 [Lacunisphaera sp.]